MDFITPEHKFGTKMSSPTIRSVNRVFDIIERVQMNGGAGITELATELDMPKSTVHSHLKTLRDRGYVTKDPDDTYHLSLQFLVLGGTVREHRTIHRHVQSLLDSLAMETGESASYLVEHNGNLVLVGSEQGEDAIRTNVHVGFTTDMHTNPEGKLLLAYLPEERRRSIIDEIEFPIDNRVGKASFMAELEEIRNEGVAFSHESIVKNVTAISAPVIDNQDVLHGVVVVAGPSLRFDEERVEKVTELLKYEISELNISITYERSQNVVDNQLSTR